MIWKKTEKPLHLRLGRVALSTLLAASMSTGAMALPTLACADTVQYDSATFTVETKDNASASYKAYRLFSAVMDENDGSNAERPTVAWPGVAKQASWNDALKQPTLKFLDSSGYGEWLCSAYNVTEGTDEFAFQHDVPQNAIEYIAEQIGASADDVDAATVPATKAQKTFALNLARAIAASGAVAETTDLDDSGNATFSGEEGYYLFMTNDASIDAGEAGSSPMWVPLGGATASIVEKTATPTLDKLVKEDSTGEYGKVADSNKGQDLNYKLVATMPQNIKSYNNFYLGFKDTLPQGMELAGGDVSSVKVLMSYETNGVVNTPDITGNSHVKVTYEENVLRVDIADLKGIYPNIDMDTTVQVLYEAHLTDEAVIGTAGNQNDAQLIYTSNPVTYYDPTDPDSPNPPDPGTPTPGTTATPPETHKTRTCTWKIELNKVDKQTHENLKGAKFTVQVADGGKGDQASANKYVQADGSLADNPHEFVTDSEGLLAIPRIDSGVYVLHETAAPEGYELQDADIRVALAVEFDQAVGTVKSWDVNVSGGEADVRSSSDVVTHLVDADDEQAMETALLEGRVSIQTSDDKKVDVPITGLDGTFAVTTAAGGVLLVSMAGLYASRRRRGLKER